MLFQRNVLTPMLLLVPTFLDDYFTVILSSTPPPSARLSLCYASVALKLATPTPISTLPHWLRRCLNPFSFPPSRPGRHDLGNRLLLSIRLRQSP
jgi:hypothetical protein